MGDIEVTQVFDGAVLRDHDPGLIKNASVDDFKASLRALGLPDEKVPIPFTVTLVKIGDRQIMFDAGGGVGALPATGNVTENAKAAGIDLSKLSTIVVSHFHPDHISACSPKRTRRSTRTSRSSCRRPSTSIGQIRP